MLLMVLVVNKEDLKLNPLPPSPCMYMEPVELLVLPTASGYIIAYVTQSSPCGSEPNGESTPSNPSQNPILKPLLPISKYGVPFRPKPNSQTPSTNFQIWCPLLTKGKDLAPNTPPSRFQWAS